MRVISTCMTGLALRYCRNTRLKSRAVLSIITLMTVVMNMKLVSALLELV